MAIKPEESFFSLEPAPKKSVPKKRTSPSSPTETITSFTPVASPVFSRRAKVKDYTMESAIKICASILHPDELEKYKNILDPFSDESLRTKIVDWRQRNGIS